MVCQTLKALSNLNYPSFEVILLDNNTDDENLWKPVEQYCRLLGSRFRFHHASGVVGAKSGALNIARGITTSKAQWICIVDADYQVEPDFLQHWLAAHERHSTDYYQFPQAYRPTHSPAANAIAELGDYFGRPAASADKEDAMLLTGTLCIMNRDLLDSVGGWPTTSSTEDAELGCLLQLHGARGRLVNECGGTGLLPPSFDELRRQRHRWICGNLLVLKSMVLSNDVLRARYRALAMQLTAWCSFTLIPSLVLFPLLLLTAINMNPFVASSDLLILASSSVCLQFVVIAILILGNGSRPFTDCLGALVVRWALSTSSSVSTLQAVLTEDRHFRCTRRSSGDRCSVSPVSAVLSVSLLICTCAAAQELPWMVTVTATLLSLALAAEYWVDLHVLARTPTRGHSPSTKTRSLHVPLRQYRHTDL